MSCLLILFRDETFLGHKKQNEVWLSLVERYVRDVALDAHFTTS